MKCHHILNDLLPVAIVLSTPLLVSTHTHTLAPPESGYARLSFLMTYLPLLTFSPGVYIHQETIYTDGLYMHCNRASRGRHRSFRLLWFAENVLSEYQTFQTYRKSLTMGVSSTSALLGLRECLAPLAAYSEWADEQGEGTGDCNITEHVLGYHRCT